MQVLGFSEFRQNLAKTLDYVADNHAPVIIKRGKSCAVVISLDDYNAFAETDYLLSSPANARHLQASMSEHKQHKTTQKALIDD